MIGARLWPIVTIVFGLGTLATLHAFSQLHEVGAAYPDGDFAKNLSAFQRARTMAEVDALFGAPADQAKLAAMHAANQVDLWIFIPVYGLFLAAAAAMLAGSVRKHLAWLAITPALIAAGADAVETWAQLQMTSDWSRAAEFLPYVAPSCWTKYFALAGHALACTFICFTQTPRRWILGALGCIPIVGVVAERIGLIELLTVMTAVFGVFWIALLVTAIIDAIRGRPSRQT